MIGTFSNTQLPAPNYAHLSVVGCLRACFIIDIGLHKLRIGEVEDRRDVLDFLGYGGFG